VWQQCVGGTERFEIIQQTSSIKDNKQSRICIVKKGHPAGVAIVFTRKAADLGKHEVCAN
jgi:hypothetical protein